MTTGRFALRQSSPLTPPESVLRGEHWRISVLLDGLLRLEWSDDGSFEDRASTFAVQRSLPTPAFTVTESDEQLEILTDRFHLTWDRRPFSTAGLSVRVLGAISAHRATWRWGTSPRTLGGTARTLDEADGAVPLEDGVASRDGIAVIDDSESFLFTDAGWIDSRVPGRRDVYVFAYGHDYADAVRALYAVSGPPPVLPRWALGNWWSRYHAYSADEYLQLMDRFEAERVPFSVAVIDMDWHRVKSVPPEYGTGWTGYSWERSLFPDPPAFLAELHRRGLRVTLNLHPHEGVQPFEDAFPAFSQALGLDPSSDVGVPFDITDERFAEAYFDVLHRPLEKQGVDFWWIDWQQGQLSNVPGVDPLWMLNHLHFVDSESGMIFSRYAGPGSQRYPVGFSGDSIISWESLRFQPHFTATASNIGYGWWSHDVGGHIFGVRDDMLTVRWIQLGVFSPINRLHSSSNPFLQKEPWDYPRQARDAFGAALRFRHRLVPYLHTMNHRAAQGDPLVRPMYWEHPAYDVPRQFLFGDSLLVAPITDPNDEVTLMGATDAWLPEGTWADIFTGTVYRAGPGGQHIRLHRDDQSIPALLQAGAALPLTADASVRPDTNPSSLELLLLPGADGTRELVEDDGGDRVSRTPLVWNEADRTLTIGPASDPSVVPAHRDWTIRFLGAEVTEATGADVTGGLLTITGAPADSELRISVRFETAPPDKRQRLFGLLARAQWDHARKLDAWHVLRTDADNLRKVAGLQALGLPETLLSALTEILVSD
ncbi:TIM-barrel domain-containing protein [Actinoplanes sp. NPDC051343]|uniref:glycoside hydrolase family 31 protein n=1 Tax=Actinoplanes sp. NPDC051343 TaxID=3363906 RepID=UPI0037A63057